MKAVCALWHHGTRGHLEWKAVPHSRASDATQHSDAALDPTLHVHPENKEHARLHRESMQSNYYGRGTKNNLTSRALNLIDLY